MIQLINYKKLGLRIKLLRIQRGMTQEMLAEKVGCNTSHISNLENAHTKASLNTLLSIAINLDCSLDSLLHEQYIDKTDIFSSEILLLFSKMSKDKKEQALRILKAL